MGRYKLGPNGGYYDPQDSGPDQFTPTPGQQVPGMPQQAQQPAPQPGRIPGTDGYYMPSVDADRMGFPQDPAARWVPYGSEGPGGMTGQQRVDPTTGVPIGGIGGPIGGGIPWQDPHQGPWMPRVIPDDQSPTYGLPKVPYTGGYDPNGPMYGKPGSWGGGEQLPTWGGGEQLPTWGGGENQPWSEKVTPFPGSMPQAPSNGPAVGIWDAIQKQQGVGYKPLSALGGIFGSSGGNVAPKAPGGIAGAVFNKYPGLFTK